MKEKKSQIVAPKIDVPKPKVKIILEPLNQKTLNIEVSGVSPLLMDKMAEETKDAILAKQTGEAKGGKKAIRDVARECENAIHKSSDGLIGYPGHGFKCGMVNAAARVGDKFFSKDLVRGSVKIVNLKDGLVPIRYKKMTTLKHTIKAQTKISPMFIDWSATLNIIYDANNISAQDIATLVNYAGFYTGIGAWRPTGRDGGSGTYGMYEVKKNAKN
jgi:hypothetical protein